MDVSVRYAKADDAFGVSAILQEAADHQRQVGSPAWDDAATSATFVSQLIVHGECVVASVNNELVGAMALQWRDEVFWADRDDDAAGYLHRIAVRRAFGGGRITVPLVAYAARETMKRGRNVLRLDCAPLPRLMAVYVRLGFKHVDFCALPKLGPGYRVARFERRL